MRPIILLINLFLLSDLCVKADLVDLLGTAGPSHWGILETGAHQVSFSGPTAGIYGTATQANLGIASGGKLNSSGTTNIQATYYRHTGNGSDSISGTTFGAIVQNAAGDALIDQAVLDANAAALSFAAMSCTLGVLCGTTLDSSMTITGVAGINVLTLAAINLNQETVFLNGPAGAEFLLLVSGAVTLNSGSIRVAGGLTPLDVVIDMTGVNKTASASGGGNASVVDGVLMNLNGKIQFSPGAVNGEVISGYDISFVSGANVSVVPVPEPSSLLSIGVLAAIALRRISVHYRSISASERSQRRYRGLAEERT